MDMPGQLCLLKLLPPNAGYDCLAWLDLGTGALTGITGIDGDTDGSGITGTVEYFGPGVMGIVGGGT